jgi:hypothetical protein
MRDLQTRANPCNACSITRNEIRSAVRVRSSALLFVPICRMNERSIGNLAPLPIPCTATVLQPEALRDCADVASWERVRSRRLYLYAIAGAALEVYAEKWLERAWSRGQPRVRQDNVTAANEPLSDNLRVFECVLILPTLRNRKRHDPTQGRSCAELRLQTVLAPEQLAPHRGDPPGLTVPPYAAASRGGCPSTADGKWKEEYPLLSTSSI